MPVDFDPETKGLPAADDDEPQGEEGEAEAEEEQEGSEAWNGTDTEGEEAEEEEPEEPAAPDSLFSLSLPLFGNCGEPFLENIASHAQVIRLKEGEAVDIEKSCLMYIVLEGSVKVAVGKGPEIVLGYGESFNAPGMFDAASKMRLMKVQRGRSLAIADPSIRSAPRGTLTGEKDEGGMLGEYRFDLPWHEGELYQEALSGKGDAGCFQALCPFAPLVPERQDRHRSFVRGISGDDSGSESDSQQSDDKAPVVENGDGGDDDDSDDLEEDAELDDDGFQDAPFGLTRTEAEQDAALVDHLQYLSIKGGQEGDKPIRTGKPLKLSPERGGARLMVVTMNTFEQASRPPEVETYSSMHSKPSDFKAGFMQLKANKDQFLANWRTMKYIGDFLFPCVCVELLWKVAELAKQKVFEKHDIIAQENARMDNITVIAEGVVRIDKLRTANATNTVPRTLGRISRGCVIGSVARLGGATCNACSAVAETNVRALVIPEAELLQLVRRFPGMLNALHSDLQEVVDAYGLDTALVEPVLKPLTVFAQFSGNGLDHMASLVERRHLYCGQVLKEQGIIDRSMWLIIHGTAYIEHDDAGYLDRYGTMELFGERTFFCLSDKTNCRVVVASPVLVAVVMNGQHILDRRRGATWTLQHDFERTCNMLAEEGDAGRASWPAHSLRAARVFKSCSRNFMLDVCYHAAARTFLPGQTLCVQGDRDSKRLRMLRYGEAGVEVDNKTVASLKNGAIFGELTVLGLSQVVTATIRATTLCISIDVDRDDLLSVMNKHPEDEAIIESAFREGDGMKNPTAFSKVSLRAVCILNFHTKREVLARDDPYWESEAALQDCFAILSGHGKVLDQNGDVVDELVAGQMFNDRRLFPIKNVDRERFVPACECKIQKITYDGLQAMGRELKEDFENLKKCIVEQHGQMHLRRCQRSQTSLVRRSQIFRYASDSFVLVLTNRLRPRVFAPGAEIVSAKPAADAPSCMGFLLEGVAAEVDLAVGDGGTVRRQLLRHATFSESVLLKIAEQHDRSVRAETACTALFLHSTDLRDATSRFQGESHRYKSLAAAESQNIKGPSEGGKHNQNEQLTQALASGLRGKILRSGCFLDVDPHFVLAITEFAEEEFYYQGSPVFDAGEPCELGKTPIFVVLGGEGVVEINGEAFAWLERGQCFGEAGAIGNADTRTAKVSSASIDGFLHVAMLRGQAVKQALELFPECKDVFEKMFKQRLDRNSSLSRKRWEAKRAWLYGKVLPALRSTSVLHGCPEAKMEQLANSLQSKHVPANTCLCETGKPLEAMMLLVEGCAVVATGKDEKVATLREGAAFGEVAMLGLFAKSTLTVKTKTPCAIVQVSMNAWHSWLDGPDMKVVRDRLSHLAEERRMQVESGLPLSCLPCSKVLPGLELLYKAVAMQAMRRNLAPGEKSEFFPEAHPNGVHVTILAAGRAVLEVGADSSELMQLQAGNIVLDGVASSSKALLRALTHCEVYKIRKCDLLTACSHIPLSCQWLLHYRMLELKAKELLEDRLEKQQALLRAAEVHPISLDISCYTMKRKEASDRARTLRRRRGYLAQTDKIEGSHRSIADESGFEERGSSCSFPDSSGLSKSRNISSSASAGDFNDLLFHNNQRPNTHGKKMMKAFLEPLSAAQDPSKQRRKQPVGTADALKRCSEAPPLFGRSVSSPALIRLSRPGSRAESR
eukprot:TRINITY_DN20183_c0_g1_i1.p1 TRINITY_DN20183_c0_g1~~TRINITY_DN20183_c0_g1_i1.p1  ORF type:complete len:1689 (-),score=446.80 TRINITY_DN20183_c0_g1_i1:78-5144(-)